MKTNSDVERFSRYQSVIKVLTSKDSFRKPDIYAIWEVDTMPIFTREGGSWGKLNKVFGGELEAIIHEINMAIAVWVFDRI